MRRPTLGPRQIAGKVATSKARRQGFTLLEVMIAISLLAVGLLALAAMQIQAMKGGRAGVVDTYATTLAQDRIERLQRLTWADVGPTSGWTTATSVSHPTNGQGYQLQWQIADVVANWTRSVDVRVTWNAPGRPNRTRVLSSLRYNWEGL